MGTVYPFWRCFWMLLSEELTLATPPTSPENLDMYRVTLDVRSLPQVERGCEGASFAM